MKRLFKGFVALLTHEKTGETIKVDSLHNWINSNDDIPYSVIFIHQCEFCEKTLPQGNVCNKCWKREGL